ncbi:MAG: glycosyltransferase [Actinobacteria bacterium]|nr:glycosyltransferase [Actinomycetota bacterium]MCB8996980.1 glycosyltransferase [Actinomycetota bacterium]MCB9414029.1 glycosyltransferase [Actinomycetota bacterium]MCB9424538.1 glycosyltransferase [Actinomycetota bacterium]HRY08618.1 glycosyltransferase [Candidatus Nanopelagicales bacterium]
MIRIAAVATVLDPPPQTQDALQALARQVAEVVAVDDGSAVPVRFSGVHVIRQEHNLGIAAALNAGIRAAAERGATHVLTVDQDSQFPDDYVAQLLAAWTRAQQQGLSPAAMGAAEFSGLTHRGAWHDGVMVVAESIQSGTLFSVEALAGIGGFDESLVIDGVDTDACLRLADAGFDICVAPVEFDHALGEGHFVTVFGHQVWASGHAPFRRYYITRNGLLLLRRHGRRHPRWALVSARRLVMASLLAAKAPEQRAAMRAGVKAAWRRRTGRIPQSALREVRAASGQ